MTSLLPKSIAIIGAGPCGTGFAKALLAEKRFDKIQLFEKRSTFGGLWNYTGHQDSGPDIRDLLKVPSEDPNTRVMPLEISNNKYIWKSPAYDTLDTNVPKDLMSYANAKFSHQLPLFPHREDVKKYFMDYSEPLREYTRFNTQIVDVRRNATDSKWQITSRSVCAETAGATSPGTGEKADVVEEYDAVVFATGNYELPFIPNRPGLKEWNEAFPGSISNAKNYRNAKQFSDSKGKILVVGNSASANDICYQLATILDDVVYKLMRSENVMPAGSSDLIECVGDISKFDHATKTIHLVDGTELKDIETVIFATGYMHSFPFFQEKGEPIVKKGDRLHGIYEHLMLYNYPNLAVAGVLQCILPTRTAETQGSWVAKVWSGKIQLPPIEEMRKWEEQRAKDSPKFHSLCFPQDIHYSNRLNAEILKINTGFMPFIWSREQISIRGSIKQIKEAYIAYKADTGKLASSYNELVESGHLKSFILTDEQMKEHGF